MSSIEHTTPLGDEGVNTNKDRGVTNGSSHPNTELSPGKRRPIPHLRNSLLVDLWGGGGVLDLLLLLLLLLLLSGSAE